jgi:hypothetical protein
MSMSTPQTLSFLLLALAGLTQAAEAQFTRIPTGYASEYPMQASSGSTGLSESIGGSFLGASVWANAGIQRELRGEGTVRLSMELGFFVGGEYRETVKLGVSTGGPACASRQRCSFELIEASSAEAGHRELAHRLPGSADEGWESFDGRACAVQVVREDQRQRDMERLAGRGVEDFLADLRSACACGEIDYAKVEAVMQDLTRKIEQSCAGDPGFFAELIARMDSLPCEDPCFELTRIAMAEAKHARPQEWLAQEARSADPRVAEASLRALFSVRLVSAGLAKASTQLLTLRSGRDAAAAALLVGTLIRRSSGEAREQLMQSLRAAYEERRISVSQWHAALGNAGSARSAELVQGELKSSDPSLRASALVALTNSSDASSLGILERHATRDPNAAVRRRAIELVGQRPTRACARILRRCAFEDPAQDLQEAATRILGARAREAAVQQVLVELSTRHADAGIRRLAYAAITR